MAWGIQRQCTPGDTEEDTRQRLPAFTSIAEEVHEPVVRTQHLRDSVCTESHHVHTGYSEVQYVQVLRSGCTNHIQLDMWEVCTTMLTDISTK